jgi:hypothetical protein
MKKRIPRRPRTTTRIGDRYGLFNIWCLRCGRETVAAKTFRKYSATMLIWQNRCLVCGEVYDALPPQEEDGERGSVVREMDANATVLQLR